MKRFKIVSSDNKSFRTNGKYRILYEEGKTIEQISKTIGIMCFDSIDNITSFLNWDLYNNVMLKSPVEFSAADRIHGKIYSVETIDEIKVPKLITFAGYYDIDNYIQKIDLNKIDGYMKDKNIIHDINNLSYTNITVAKHIVICLQKPPRGTICAKKIKLLKLKYYITLNKEEHLS